MNGDSSDGGVVLVGGGLAAVSAARALRASGHEGALRLVTDEEHEPYDRPPLSKQYLSGDLTREALHLFGPGELSELRIDLIAGRSAVALDAHARILSLDDGNRLDYEALVIATGAEARRLSFGDDLGGVHYLRSRADSEAVAESLRRGGPLVVIGAGFIGLEVAATARSAGLDVTVLEAAPAALTRVLGSDGGSVVTRIHQERGVVFHFGAEVLALTGQGQVDGVRCRIGGEVVELAADAVVVGVGAAPRVDWLAGSPIAVDDGVVCDGRGRTNVSRVYAAGDVSRWQNELTRSHRRVEQWQAALEQGAVVGATIAGDLGACGADGQPQAWSSIPYFWSDQYEHKLQFCGSPGAVTAGRETARGWVACYAQADDGAVTGVFAVDAPSALARGRRLVARSATWPEALSWLDGL